MAWVSHPLVSSHWCELKKPRASDWKGRAAVAEQRSRQSVVRAGLGAPGGAGWHPGPAGTGHSPGLPEEQGPWPASRTAETEESLSLKMFFLLCQLGFGIAKNSVSPALARRLQSRGMGHHPTVALVLCRDLWLSVKLPHLILSPTKETYLASFKFHVIPLNPITEIIIFPFSLFSSTFSKAEESYLGTWALLRASFFSVRNKNSDTK